MAIVSFIIGILLVAALSVGLAYILDTQAPNMGWRRRALYAAFGGAFIPTLLPITAVLLAAGDETAALIAGLVGILIGGFMFAGLVGYPVAYWFCKRREKARGSLDPAKEFL